MSQIDEKVRQVAAQYEHKAKEAEQRAQQAQTARSQAAQQQQVAAESQKWMNWVDERIKTHFKQRIQHLEAQIFPDAQGEPGALLVSIGEALGQIRNGIDKDIDAAVAGLKVWFEGRIETKVWPRLDALEQRIGRIEREMEGRLAPGALHETQRAAEAQFETKIEAKIAALEERVRSVPGKLPPAKDWCAESVT